MVYIKYHLHFGAYSTKMPTRAKIDVARSIRNLFSKIRILREAENIHDGDRSIPRGFRHPEARHYATLFDTIFPLKLIISLYTRQLAHLLPISIA